MEHSKDDDIDVAKSRSVLASKVIEKDKKSKVKTEKEVRELPPAPARRSLANKLAAALPSGRRPPLTRGLHQGQAAR